MKTLILHISDIHLHANGNPAEAKFDWIGKAVQNEEIALGSVIVVVSGDVAYSGQTSEYAVAAQHLTRLREDLCQRTGTQNVRFVFVPGNHDCDFTRPDKSVREAVIESVRRGSNSEIDDGKVAFCAGVQDHFFAFRDSFPTAVPDHSPDGRVYWEYVIAQSDGTTLLFRCYNTAWISRLREQQGEIHYPASHLKDTSVAAELTPWPNCCFLLSGLGRLKRRRRMFPPPIKRSRPGKTISSSTLENTLT